MTDDRVIEKMVERIRLDMEKEKSKHSFIKRIFGYTCKGKSPEVLIEGRIKSIDCILAKEDLTLVRFTVQTLTEERIPMIYVPKSATELYALANFPYIRANGRLVVSATDHYVHLYTFKSSRDSY